MRKYIDFSDEYGILIVLCLLVALAIEQQAYGENIICYRGEREYYICITRNQQIKLIFMEILD